MIKIWIGRRETDLLTYPSEYFDFSITYYGSNKNNNYSYDVNKRTCLKYDINFFMFVIQKITEITNGYNYSLFFYNARLAQKLIKYDNKILGHIKYCNSFELLRWFNNKSYTRMWLSNYVSVPPFLLLSKHDCTIEFLSKSFPTIDKFALQLNYSSGGTGTYILEKETASKTYNLLFPIKTIGNFLSDFKSGKNFHSLLKMFKYSFFKQLQPPITNKLLL